MTHNSNLKIQKITLLIPESKVANSRMEGVKLSVPRLQSVIHNDPMQLKQLTFINTPPVAHIPREFFSTPAFLTVSHQLHTQRPFPGYMHFHRASVLSHWIGHWSTLGRIQHA